MKNRKHKLVSQESISTNCDSSRDKNGEDSKQNGSCGEERTKIPYLGTYDEAPDYIKKCKYILTGYRINFNSFKVALRSLFMIHNETTNIWSHLFGVFLYIFLVIYITFWTATDNVDVKRDDDTILGLPVLWINNFNSFIARYILWVEEDIINSEPATKIPLYIHMGGNIVCMSLSSFYHLFSCHSNEVNCMLYKYDYSGVSLMISCSIYPPYVYGFMCPQQIHFAYIYTSIINISSLMLLIVCIHPKFDNEGLRWLRALLYCVVGLSCGLPGVHAVFFGDRKYLSYANYFLWALGGFFFVFGAFVYTKRFPEKKYPGKFDYFGQSHNIWHFFVLLGGITHFFGSLSNYYGRRVHTCPPV